MKKSLKEQLPETFVLRMKELLGSEYEAFSDSYEERTYAGSAYEYAENHPGGIFEADRSDIGIGVLVSYGFYYNGSREYSKNPLYHAGLYYIQEPSAMVSGPGTSCFAGRCYP